MSTKIENLIKGFKVLLMVVEVGVDILVVQWYISEHVKKVPPTYLQVTVTAYRPEKKFTDSSPHWTSVGSPTVMGMCAVSQDLLQNGTVQYGDNLDVPGLGVFKVLDTMNPRHRNHVDILVYTKAIERCVGWRRGVSVKVLR